MWRNLKGPVTENIALNHCGRHLHKNNTFVTLTDSISKKKNVSFRKYQDNILIQKHNAKSCYKWPPAPGLKILPVHPLELSLVPRDWGSLLRLRDVADIFPFAGPTTGEAEHVSQRHTDVYRQTPTWTHTQRTHIRHGHGQPCTLLLLGWQREGHWCSTHTTLSRFTSTPTLLGLPSSDIAPLPACLPCQIPGPLPTPWVPTCQLVQLGAGCKHTALTCPSHRHPTLMGHPTYQHGPFARLINLPRPKASPTDWLVQLGVCQRLYMHTPCKLSLGKAWHLGLEFLLSHRFSVWLLRCHLNYFSPQFLFL